VQAKSLPAAPATRAQLDSSCAPPALFLRWLPDAPPREQPGLASPWQLPAATPRLGATAAQPQEQPADAQPSPVLAGPAGAAIARFPPTAGSRSILFGQPEVFFAGDLQGGGEDALALARNAPLLLEVHDRTALLQPPEFPLEPLPGSEGQDGAGGEAPADSEGYVCGLARIPLLDLARGARRQQRRPVSSRVCPVLLVLSCLVCCLQSSGADMGPTARAGYTRVKFNANLAPHTTVRGAASLDWTKRPGLYPEVTCDA
jgi:hypothetical protein